MEHKIITTTDGIQLVVVYRNDEQSKVAILLHMMPATKESWDAFASRLSKEGFASLAIDERGHGESTMNRTLDYKVFTDEQQQAKRLDVEAGIEFVAREGFAKSQIVVIGASIGANLAIQALVEHSDILTAVALSPGLDYHGVLTENMILRLHRGQKVVLVASDDDAYSLSSVRALHAVNPQQTILIERSGTGHGTAMTDKDPGLVDEIVGIIKN